MFCFYFPLLLLVIWLFVCYTICACVWDTSMIMCLIILCFNACLNDDILPLMYDHSYLALVMSAFLFTIIMSAPPRCMWHGRVTHDPNRLCICIQKQILNNAQIYGELFLISYFSKRRYISFLLSFVEALIYMLSSITKKGEIKSATHP